MTDDPDGDSVETSEYLPYGGQREQIGTSITDYKFTDQELDTKTGLYNYDARLYDPVIGRFITPDPIIPEVYNPQSLNRYSYVLNNPLKYTDPTGHLVVAWGGGAAVGCTGNCGLDFFEDDTDDLDFMPHMQVFIREIVKMEALILVPLQV